MSLPKKVLLALTSAQADFWPDGTQAGLWYSEALHPYQYFVEKGFEVTLASETSTYFLDPHSTADESLGGDKDTFNDASAPFNQALKSVQKASELNSKDFGIFFAAGGHGALFDFPNADSLHKLAAEIYEQGGVVAAVCHGPAIFDNLNLADGTALIKGKTITGFTVAEEDYVGVTQIIADRKLDLVKDVAAKNGAKYVQPDAPFTPFAIADGRVISGTNPASAHVTAEKALEAFSA
ncbi:unnamed protein product [Kuraishia capsulata CBS 1993]|uniref:D-lactate dehydratase n=1 Tax=Kuraishia capsulata CBS 1993 TaxID=1382522 RepID=W6MLS9_9ASCO|nr:uncharacterized protein KUCA_T00003065001 [Kuraishia capsulata CBS 1993]CDK27088.1 unnamed protein product [Kuraishia capsulata CBS 1993]